MDNAKVSDYVIIKNKYIGEGAFSKVYLGYLKEDPSQKVAIKEINLSKVSDNLRERFFEENHIINLLKQNPHKNIITCHSIIHTLNRIYIIMEYCESGELGKLIKKYLSESQVKFYFKQITEALIHLDNLKIIHRDIKPANILLTNNDKTIKITDFGLSCIKPNTSSLMNTICGSPFYMSPEILNEQQYSKGTDIWSLGIILYELLYGIHPFGYSTDIYSLRENLNTREIIFPTSNKKKEELSTDSIDLLKKLLDKNALTRLNLHSILSHSWFDTDINNEMNTLENNTLTLDPISKTSIRGLMKNNIFPLSDSIDDNYFSPPSRSGMLEVQGLLPINIFNKSDKSTISKELDIQSVKVENNMINKTKMVPIPNNVPKMSNEIIPYKPQYPGSAPNTWSLRLVDSIWNFGASTIGYLSKLSGLN